MSELQTVNTFADSGANLVPVSAGAVAAHAREQHELQSLITVAQHIGRNERAAYDRVMASCARPSFADGCVYSFPRGGQKITGPSVKLARELARCWGSIMYELRVVEITEEEIHIRGVAIDLISLSRVAMEDRFAKKVQRKGGWIVPDERDLRELVNRRGAILVRNALLQLLPPDVVDDAQEAAHRTLEEAAQGNLERDRPRVIQGLIGAFKKYGVTKSMLEDYLQRPIESLTSKDVADLTEIGASLRDGQSRVEDHFNVKAPAPPSAGASALNQALQGQGGASAPPEAPNAPAGATGAQEGNGGQAEEPPPPQEQAPPPPAELTKGATIAAQMDRQTLLEGVLHYEAQLQLKPKARNEMRATNGCHVALEQSDTEGLRKYYAALYDQMGNALL